MRIGLRGKSVAFLAVYTLVLEGSGLVYFYASGREALRRASGEEVKGAARQGRASVERALSDTLAEMGALRPQLLMQGGVLGEAGRRALLGELAVSEAGRYARLGLYDPATGRRVGVRAVREFRGTYPVADDRVEAGGGAVREGEVRVSLPLEGEGGPVLMAELYLDGLLEGLAELALPAGVRVVAVDGRGLIVWAAEPEMLRTYMRREELGRGASAIGEERVGRPELRVVAYKDERAEVEELRRELGRVAAFAGLATALGLAAIWVVTGRMARLLQQVVGAAGRVAHGDFAVRIKDGRDDELGDLIESINGMTERLEGSYRELTEVNLKLREKVGELRRTRRRLVEKQRLAAVGEAMSKISHEIQNKVGGVGVWVQNLERMGARDEATRECAGELRGALDGMLEMLVHFKRFYRRPAVERAEMEAGWVVRESVGRAEAAARARGVELQAWGGAMRVEADGALMADALTNVVLNAVEASGRGGAVEVEVRGEEGCVVWEVRDRGPGLAEKGRLFRPFYTTKAAGSGLGLSIVRSVVKAHGGRVKAWNREGGGACFELRIPVSAGGADENPAG